MSALRNVASLLFVLALPAALVTTNIRFMANEPRVYRYAVDDFGAVATTGIAREELLRAMRELRAYFNAGGDEPVAIRVERQGREQPLFNPRETAHLKDVKARFRMQNAVQEFSVLYVLTYIAAVVIWSREVSVRRLAVNTMAGSALTVVAIAGVGAFAVSGFDSAWTQFHEVLFSNDFWLLNPRTDHLIQIFPPEFWQNIVFFVGLVTAAEAGLILLVSGLYLGATARRAAEPELAPSFS
ncbi:MAG TPA: TIGR01906 family membrane protein [Dehalococcoidia bacterium]|jgi:integral membrane protein (TIGR01906 family)|nr:TIGR01906 family membrane protein [Dehalococcoidia bacterium]